MPRKVIDAPIREMASASVSGQLTPATTATNRRGINFRRGFKEVLLEPEDQAMRVGFVPKLVAAYHYDASLVAAERFIDLMAYQDGAITDSGSTGTVPITTMAAADYLILGHVGRVGGWYMDLTTPFNTAANSNWSGDNMEYSTKNGWVATGITDGTEASANVAFGQDGVIEITTVPADGTWQPAMLKDLFPGESVVPSHGHTKLYWTRMQPTNAHNAATTVNQIIPLLVTVADGTGNSDASQFKASTEYTLDLDDGRYGSLETWSVATGASDLRITWIKR